MKLKKSIFESRLSGKPLKLKLGMFKRFRTAQVKSLLQYGVIKSDKVYPFDRTMNSAVFILNDSVIVNGDRYAAGMRIIFRNLNLNEIMRVK